MNKLTPLKTNTYGARRDPFTCILSPLAFYERSYKAQLGDALSPDLFIMDAHDTRIPTWYVVGRMTLEDGVIFCLENLQSDIMPRIPESAPFTIALLVTREYAYRTKGPYQRILMPDLYEIAALLKAPHSSMTACVCPFTIPVKCESCKTSMFVLSHPLEAFNHRLCVACTYKRNKEQKHRHGSKSLAT